MDKPPTPISTPPTSTPLPQATQVAPPAQPSPVKKYLPLVGVALGILTLVIIGLTLLKPGKTKQAPKSKIAEAVNIVPVSDRPYVTLEPTDSGTNNPERKDHPFGKEVLLKVHTVTLGATEANYELEYQAGSLLQAAIGTMNLVSEQLPANRNILLGSCSAGGKCSYNEDVTGGTVLLRLTGGSQKFAVKGEWTYQLMGNRGGQFSSRDSKFRVDVGPNGLPSSTYVIIVQTMGLPQAAEGEVIAGPYHITVGGANIKSAEVSVRVPEDATTAKLLGWTGSTWKEYKSTLVDQTLTATVDSLTTFVAVK